MNIGRAIRKARKALKLTQKQLALQARITQTTLSSIERNEKRPHPSTLANIAKAIKTPEGLIHILAIDEKDVPKKKREIYKKLFPVVEDLIMQIVKE